MKNSKNNTYLFMTLVILAGVFCSCEKEQYPESKLATVNVTSSEAKGGDDEEEPIIQGIVQDGDSTLVIGAQVEIFDVNTSNSLPSANTDSAGAFQMTVPVGTYYFQVTEGITVYTTGNFLIDRNSSIVITLD